MSGIAGIYHTDGRPLDRPALDRMVAALAHRGPDGTGTWTDGPIGLAHLMLCTTPESLHEKQPLGDETGELCLTMDGRVDNREELRRELLARGFHLRTDTDAELVLRAYECWGEACPTHIIGDFAFAIWDRRRRQLFCARDPLGVKPFYYWSDGRRFLWASELRPVLEQPDVPRRPNEGMVGEYLAAAITHQEETLWEGVLRLAPAYSLTVGPDGLRKRRYWGVDPGETPYRSDDERAEHFLHVFREAVRCRLRSHLPVGAELSGGLDSSSVVCVAQQLRREGAVFDHGFETFSVMFPGLACDETAYITDVIRMWDVTAHLVPWQRPNPSIYHEAVRATLDFPGYPNGVGMSAGYRTLARDRGIRALLTGVGGDDWLTGAPVHYSRLMREGAWLALAAEVLEKARAGGFKKGLLSLTRHGLVPFLPPRLRRVTRAIAAAYMTPRSVDPRFARRIGLAQRLVAGAATTSPHKGPLIRWGPTPGWDTHALDTEERATSALSLELRHPFLDRRLVEVALSIPRDWHWDSGRTKRLPRLAMRDLLPETVRTRLTKPHFSHLFVLALREQGVARVSEGSAVARAGWVRARRAVEMHVDMLADHAGHHERYAHTWPLWMAQGIDLWLTQ